MIFQEIVRHQVGDIGVGLKSQSIKLCALYSFDRFVGMFPEIEEINTPFGIESEPRQNSIVSIYVSSFAIKTALE